MKDVFEKMLQEIYEDKPNEQGVRLQKKTTLISKEGEIFTLTIERGDVLNDYSKQGENSGIISEK